MQSKTRTDTYEKVDIGGMTVHLPPPVSLPNTRLVGRDDIIEKTLAAWTVIGEHPPLNFRLYGPPGVGKNAIVYELARILGRELYIINGHDELGPEDIACTATITSRNRVEYVASPLFTGMYRGGIVFFDEIGKAPSSALDPLASVLDDRRELTSVLTGIRIKADPGFLFCAALNDIEETGVGLPSFLDERTRPAIDVGYPTDSALKQILQAHFPDHDKHWVSAFIVEFKDATISPRTAITLLGYACRLFQAKHGSSVKTTEKGIRQFLQQVQTEAGHERIETSVSQEPKDEETLEEIDSNEDALRTAFDKEGSVH